MLVQFHRNPTLSSLPEDLLNFERTIDNVFNRVLGDETQYRYRYYPRFDLVEYDNESVLFVELAGLTREDIKITVENGYLMLSGERKPVNLPEGSNWIRQEIWTGKFQRSIELPHDIDVNHISAELTHGVLRVTLPKAESVKPREISIK